MKMHFLIIIVAALTSCKGGTNPDVPVSDSVTTESKETKKSSKDQTSFGIWTAHIEQTSTAKTDSFKLFVNGSVDLDRQNAKVILIKAEQKNPGELILNLSKRPRKTMDKPAIVSYTETISRTDQYQYIRIMHRNDTVAILSTIGFVKK